jgi:hypothetical protein
VQIPDLTCVGLVQTEELQGLVEFRQLLQRNLPLLRASPLGLISLVLEHRSRVCEMWLENIWLRTIDIETFTGKIPKSWQLSTNTRRQKELADPEARHTYILSTHAETCFANGVVQSGLHLVEFCTNAIDVVDEAVSAGGGARTSFAVRAALEDRNRFFESRYRSLAVRAPELLARQEIQITCVSPCHPLSH